MLLTEEVLKETAEIKSTIIAKKCESAISETKKKLFMLHCALILHCVPIYFLFKVFVIYDMLIEIGGWGWGLIFQSFDFFFFFSVSALHHCLPLIFCYSVMRMICLRWCLCYLLTFLCDRYTTVNYICDAVSWSFCARSKFSCSYHCKNRWWYVQFWATLYFCVACFYHCVIPDVILMDWVYILHVHLSFQIYITDHYSVLDWWYLTACLKNYSFLITGYVCLYDFHVFLKLFLPSYYSFWYVINFC